MPNFGRLAIKLGTHNQHQMKMFLTNFFYVAQFTSVELCALDVSFEPFSVIALMFFFFHRHLGSQLSELEKLIDIMIQEEFHKHVTSELNRPVSDLTPLVDEVRHIFIALTVDKLTAYISVWPVKICLTTDCCPEISVRIKSFI